LQHNIQLQNNLTAAQAQVVSAVTPAVVSVYGASQQLYQDLRSTSRLLQKISAGSGFFIKF